MNGYAGRLLHVDLSNKKMWTTDTHEAGKKFLGGSGLAADILFRETKADTDPLGPENILCFITGPATGTGVFCAGRHQIAAKSPLGNYGEANAGGQWGVMLKQAGYDGIIVRGASDEPVYLWIDNGNVEIRSAAKIWGKDTFETAEEIKNATHSKAQVTCIGPAGEKLVKLAAVMSEGKSARAAARGGLGAVMGSKKLKGIAVYGNAKVSCFDEQGIKEINRRIAPGIIKATEITRKYGTGYGVQTIEAVGDLPIKNWSQGSWKDGAAKVNAIKMLETMNVKTVPCHKCIIACSKEIISHQGPYGTVDGRAPEYESFAALGSYVLVDDLEAVVYANELCNKYGIDTISVGGTIAFAIEIFERGIITEEEIGFKPAWGDPKTLINFVHMIGRKEGFGSILSEGSRGAARIIGKGSEAYAMQIKGLELPAHDPRARTSLALAYATANRGACHLQGQSSIFESFATDPSIGIDKPLAPYASEGKAELVMKAQAIGSMYDSICLCRYFRPGADVVANLIAKVTGMDMTVQSYLEMGTRIFTLKRLFNLRAGLSYRDDVIPERIAKLAFPDGGSQGNLPDLETMLKEYYQIQGWTEDGVPKVARLVELGLEEYIDLLPEHLIRN